MTPIAARDRVGLPRKLVACDAHLAGVGADQRREDVDDRQAPAAMAATPAIAVSTPAPWIALSRSPSHARARNTVASG